MPSIDIDGTPVVFPFKPYDCQLIYIRGVITALTESKNALLESPTGTGKTLCLLCASLAWQQKNASAMASQPPPPPATELAYEKTTVTDLSRPRQQHRHQQASAAAPALPSVIIYASRTHSQLSQVAGELKNTIYRPRLSLLGSRDQLCVHEEVSQMKGPAKNHACQALVGARRCKYHRGTDGMEQAGGGAGGAAAMNSTGGARGHSEQNTVSDIEELVSLAKQHEFCPYYLGRAQAPRAELVLMPYNYLLDPGTRRGIKLNWSNSVVIFDEAHNLENVASEAASFELTSAQVAGAQEEALRCHKILTEGGGGVDEEVGSAAQADDALAVKQALHLLEDAMEGIELPSSGSASRGVTRAGEFVYALFEHAGITFGTASLWLGKLQEISDTLQENALYGQANALKLESVARAIKVAFRGGNASREECLSLSQMYRAHVAPAETVIAPVNGGDRRGRGGIGIGSRRGAGGGGAGRVLCFWCFCPGVAMEDLRALGVRSIIITSGTLSPLSSFANELRLPFEVQVENPHVIGPEQAWIGTLGRGVTNVALNSSYANRDNDQYKDELGATLANLCRIVPGGMLVFFSTYRTMNECVQRWKHYDNGKTWSRIAAHKEPVVEPRTAADLKAVMEKYDARIESMGGAVFLAVCRGKVSEGMDFSDGRARCVVVTGIPYAPAMDAKVILKKKYMSESPLPPGVPRVTGQEWYQQQASRAVNQAIGRVIRHRRDFGCVVLCDARFAEERNRQSLSLWARPFVRECNGFGKVAADLTRFFKACAANPNLKHVDTATSGPPQPQVSRPRTAGAARAMAPSDAGSRRLKGATLGGGERELAVTGSGEGRDTVDLASLQDVGDIVHSVGGRGGGREASESLGGSRRGGSYMGEADGASGVSSGGPLGLFRALKASAHLVDGGEVRETTGPSDRRDLAGSGSGSGEHGGSGWESVPLSQRLAKVGTKNASVSSSSSSSSGARASARQPLNRANPGKHQSGRASGLGGGRSVGGGSDAGGGAGHRDFNALGLYNNDGGGGSGSGSGGARSREISTPRDRKALENDAGEKCSPTARFSQKSRASAAGGSGSRIHRRSDTDSDITETTSTSAAPPKQSTMLPRGDGRGMERSQKTEHGGSGGGGDSGNARRQKLEAFLSDLKKGVSRGAYDVFRSRAKAMKEGALEATETALPALKGVLEVLLLAPSELMMPGRFADHIPEEHKDLYRTLVAKRRPETGALKASKNTSEGGMKRRDGHSFGRGSGSVNKEHLFNGDDRRAARQNSIKKGSRVLQLGRPGDASGNSCHDRKPGDRKLVGAKGSGRSPSQSSSRGTMAGGAEATPGTVGIGASTKRARLMAGGRDDSVKPIGSGDGSGNTKIREVAVEAPSGGGGRGGAEGRYKSREGGASQHGH